MGILEVIVLAAKFLFTEFPELLAKYKLYRKDKNYKNKVLAYEEAYLDYKKSRISDDRIGRLKSLRELGER